MTLGSWLARRGSAWFAATLLLCFVSAGCSGGVSVPPPGLSATPTPSPAPTATPTPNTNVFVTDDDADEGNGGGAVDVWPATATGNVAPATQLVSGPSPEHYTGLAVDAAGDVYVANYAGNAVLYFAAGSSGTPAPTTTLVGPSSGFFVSNPSLGGGVQGLSLDPAGNLWVADNNNGTIYEFATPLTANEAPTRTISDPTYLQNTSGTTSGVEGVAVDSAGNVYASAYGGSGGYNGNGIFEWAPGNNGSYTSVLTSGITGACFVAVDPADRIIVPECGGTEIHIFAAGSAATNEAPVSNFTSSSLTSLEGVGTDPNGDIYAVSGTGSSAGVFEFAPSSNGTVTPMTAITGSSTTLQFPLEVAIPPLPGAPSAAVHRRAATRNPRPNNAGHSFKPGDSPDAGYVDSSAHLRIL